MEVGFKVRCYPTKQQEQKLLGWCNFAHKSWNYLVGKYKDNLPKVGCFGIIGFTPTQLQIEMDEEVPERVSVGILRTYAQAVKCFYAKKRRPPCFHKYNPKKQSFYFSSRTYKNYGNYIVIRTLGKSQTKLMFDTNLLLGSEIIEPRFTYHNKKWFMSGCYKVNDIEKRQELSIVGLDWGIKNFMTASDGRIINYPVSVLREYQRIRKLQSYKSKKIKSSNNYKKVEEKLEKAFERFENIKNNFIQQETTRLCKNNNVAIEDLTNAKIKMSNKNRRRLRLIAPLTRFILQLEWKAKKFGSMVYKINPAFTSQTCSQCGKRHPDLTLADRTFICDCGLILDRDINAAINIAAKVSCYNL